MIGIVERYIMKKLNENGSGYIPLIDPEKTTPEIAAKLAIEVEVQGALAVMVGGSTFVSSKRLDAVVQQIKQKIKIPVILFPNNITGVSVYADAIWFMSLLNSYDPYFITGAQVLAAPLIKRFGLEAIPLAYLIVGEGGAAAVIGKAHPIPYNKPKLAIAHALAAEYLGMRFVYLEAGSGVGESIPTEMVRMVKEMVSIPVVVGGGIRTGEQAQAIVNAGADIIVTGNVLEESEEVGIEVKIRELIEGIKAGSYHK